MKKILCLALLGFIFTACSVGTNTGAITIYNKSDIDSGQMWAGDKYLGTIKSGGIKTLYFCTSREDAEISVGGFSPSGGLEGKIDLEFNYFYSLVLFEQGNSYYFTITASEGNQNSTPIME